METLKKLFYSPKTGLRSSSLYSKAKSIDPLITKNMVKEFLSKQMVTDIFKPRKIKRFFPLIALHPGRLQIDLMDFSSEDTRSNKNMKWLFCAIDVYSRFSFCYPQKSKSEKDCLESLKSLIRDCLDLGIPIYQIDSDSESAFLSRSFKKELEDNGIKHNIVPVGNKNRVGIIERFNGTVRSFLNRYKTVYRTTNWVDVIPDFVRNYNSSLHSTLKKSPEEALKDSGALDHMINASLLAMKEDYNKETFSRGDKVRLRMKYGKFEKKSNTWTKSIHTVEDIKGHDIYVTDRVQPYRKEDLLKINENENGDIIRDENREKEEEESLHNHRGDRRMNRKMNKEGINQKGESTEEELNSKALRRYKPREFFAPMISN